jgi:hypothetical protein
MNIALHHVLSDGMFADSRARGCNTHHILGQVLACSPGVLLLGRHEPHTSGDLAASIRRLDWNRARSSRAFLVSLQNGEFLFTLHTLKLLGPCQTMLLSGKCTQDLKICIKEVKGNIQLTCSHMVGAEEPDPLTL